MSRMNTRACAARQGWSFIELVMATLVFSLVSLSVFQFTRWMNAAQALTTWKQSGIDAVRLNAVFWQKYFTSATGKISSLPVDPMGVLIGVPVITFPPLRIRSRGVGDLLAGYPDGATNWVLWQFNAVQRRPDGRGYQDRIVTAYLSGRRPDLRLHARVQVGDRTVLQQNLLSNVASLTGAVRPYPERSAYILTLEFVLQHPLRSNISLREQSQFTISTVLAPFDS